MIEDFSLCHKWDQNRYTQSGSEWIKEYSTFPISLKLESPHQMELIIIHWIRYLLNEHVI